MTARKRLAALALALVAALTLLAAPALASPPPGPGQSPAPPSPLAIPTPPKPPAAPPPQQTLCNTSDPSWAWQQADRVVSKANGFNTSGQKFCIEASGTYANPGPPGFRVLTSLRYTGAWQAYPYSGAGCAYGLRSAGTDLPRKVWRLPPRASTSFSWRGPAPGNWNASYDIWFDKRSQCRTEDDGAELMIWLRPNPGYHGGQLVRVGGQWFWFVHWRTHDQAGIGWNYIQFRYTHTVHSVRNLALMPFIVWCIRHGHLIRWRWDLTSVHAGYEIVSGGAGLTTTYFDAHT